MINHFIDLKKLLLLSLFLVAGLFILLDFAPTQTFAAGWGWVNPYSSSGACWNGLSKVKFETRRRNTDALVNAGKITVEVIGRGTVTGTTTTSTSGCIYNPSTDGIKVTVAGGNGYKNLWTQFLIYNPKAWKNKLITFHIHVQPAAESSAVSQVSPGANAWVNADPSFVINARNLVTVHGASRLTKIYLNVSGPTSFFRTFSGSWSPGNISIGSQGLVDGWYNWSFWVNDNLANFSISAWSEWRGFGKDTRRPGVVSTSHSPATPNNTQAVNISARYRDQSGLSGLRWIQIRYNVNGGAYTAPIQSGNYGGAFDRTFTTTRGPWSAGSRICYQARARDVAGNVSAWGGTKCFTVVTAPGVIQGRIWRDTNGDGVQNAGESLIRNNSGVACAGYVNSNARVMYSGPSSGTKYPTLCNSGGPYYSTGNIPIGAYTVTGVPPPGWEVTTTSPRNVTLSAGQFVNVWFGMRRIPDCTVTVTPSTTTVEQDDPEFTYGVTVSTPLAYPITVDLSSNDLTSDDITLTLGDNSVIVSSGAPYFTTIKAKTTRNTPVGTYQITVTGKKGDTNCPGSADLKVDKFEADPWLQTIGGDVGSIADIGPFLRDPFDPSIPINITNADYLILTDGSISNFASRRGWQVENYANFGGVSIPLDTKGYDALYQKYTQRCGPTSFTGQKPSDIATAVVAGGCNIVRYVPGTYVTHDYWKNVGYSGNPAIVFIENNMKVTRNMVIATGTGVIFVVKGNIDIDKEVTRIDGMFITDGTFTTSQTACNNSGNFGEADQLEINGAVYVFGSGEACFTRALEENENENKPAETINYEPKYLWLFQESLGDSVINFRELAP